jgi:TetR/AcrR family transcriptional regulator, cholesterol catabolism regulator
MAAASSPAKLTNSRRRRPAPVTSDADSRYDRRLAEILAHATDVFYERGYDGASMRELSRASGMSLAGLYYYFESKERLLYLIQKHTFETIVEHLRDRLKEVADPEQRIRVLILNHLDYFLSNPKAMKVLSHEDDALKDELGTRIAAIKREYYRIGIDLLDHYKRVRGLEFSSRIAVLSLFGMMNWIYTWYNARVDGNAGDIARQMADTFLQGVDGAKKKRGPAGSKRLFASKEC